MKIAFTTEYSYPSKCGVWNTVYNTAKELQKKGHEIHIFSTNIIKGTNKKSKELEKIEGITYHRFPVKFKIGENGYIWNFKKELIKLNPEIIHAHSFRHYHSNIIPKIAKKLRVPCYLTTHAPFLEKNIRNPISQFLVDMFDLFLSRKILNSYTKVFPIAKWEIPFLLTLGCNPKKIKLIPNGVAEEFLKIKPKYSKNAIFMGRISPVKNLETILKAAKELPEINFTIYGPLEKGYSLNSNIKNVKIINKPYNQNDEILELSQNSFFILPSKTESMPLSLLEAMASGLVCISSDTNGGREIINDKNGCLFKINDHKKLISILKKIDKKSWERISKEAKNSMKKRTWKRIAETLEKEYYTI